MRKTNENRERRRSLGEAMKDRHRLFLFIYCWPHHRQFAHSFMEGHRELFNFRALHTLLTQFLLLFSFKTLEQF